MWELIDGVWKRNRFKDIEEEADLAVLELEREQQDDRGPGANIQGDNESDQGL